MRQHFVSPLAPVFVLVALASVACSGGGGPPPYEGTPGASSGSSSSSGANSSSSSGGSSSSGSTSSSSGTSSSGGPRTDGPLSVVSLRATSPKLTLYPTSGESAKTEVIAIITHSGGSERIAGGQLEDDDGHVYGAFGAGANKSTFVVALDWAAINAVSPLTLERGGKRRLTARFFDNDGHRVSDALELAFQCRIVSGAPGYPLATPFPSEGIPTGAYLGKCFSDKQCGTQGVACANGTSCSAETGQCEDVVSSCVDRADFPLLGSAKCWCDSLPCTAGQCTCER